MNKPTTSGDDLLILFMDLAILVPVLVLQGHDAVVFIMAGNFK